MAETQRCVVAALFLVVAGASAAPIRAEVLTHTGPVDGPMDPPASVVTGALESDTRLVLFPEQRNLALPGPVEVDVTEPGSVSQLGHLTPGSVTAGTFVDSYFVHVDPVGTPSQVVTYSATFSFDRDVLGVMVDRDTKAVADAVLGAQGTSYGLGGLDFSLDRLALSNDRRKLSVELAANSGVDQLRILTKGTPEILHLANLVQQNTPRNKGADNRVGIQSPFTNGDPTALVFLTMTSQPTGVFLINEWSVRYDDVRQKRVVSPVSLYSGEPAHHVLVVEPGPDAFAHTTTAGNTTYNWTYVDHPRANGDPDARLLVQHDEGIGAAAVEHPHWIGVFYDGAVGRWAIYNEDQDAMDLGLTFNVLVLPDDDTNFVHTVDASNVPDAPGWRTRLDHPALNGNEDVIFYVMHNWNPGGGPGIYHDRYFGLYYDASAGAWDVTMGTQGNIGKSFNVYIPPSPSFSVQHRAEVGNTSFNATYVDHPSANGSLPLALLETPTLSPEGGVGAPNPGNTGLWYDGGGWSIFNQDGAPYPYGAATNLLQPGEAQRSFVHAADAEHAVGNSSYLDHPHTLGPGSEDRMIFVTQTWNPDGGPSGVYNDWPIGVWYDDAEADWAVFNQTLIAPMTPNAAFNVFVAPPDSDAFVHSITAANSDGSATILDHPLLNGNPGSRVLLTSNWNPGGGAGVYNPHPIATDYDPTAARWRIVNQNGANLDLGASFNVLPLPEPGTTSMLLWGGVLLAWLAHRRSPSPKLRRPATVAA